jgi:hypothetical protein
LTLIPKSGLRACGKSLMQPSFATLPHSTLAAPGKERRHPVAEDAAGRIPRAGPMLNGSRMRNRPGSLLAVALPVMGGASHKARTVSLIQ